MKIPGMQNLEDRYTWDDIVKLESEGYDMKEIKERFLVKQAKREEEEKYAQILRYTMDPVEDKYILNKTDITKLESMVDEYRDPKSKIIKDSLGGPPFWGLFGKSKWEEGIRKADLFYASVVQCHPQFWKKILEDLTPGVILLAYSLNPKYMRDVKVMKKVSKLLSDFRDRDDISRYSAAMQKLHNDLNDPSSLPHVVLDITLLSEIGITETDADIRLAFNYIYTDSNVPNKKLPSDGIIPYINYRDKGFKVSTAFGYATEMVHSKYYI